MPFSVLVLALLPLLDACGSAVDEAKAGLREAVAGYRQIDICSTVDQLESTQSAADESWNTLQASVETMGEDGHYTYRLEGHNLASESVAEDQPVEVFPASALFGQ